MFTPVSSSNQITLDNPEFYAICNESKESIFIEKVFSKIQGNGSGTKFFREFVAKSLSECSGKIELMAAWSSHVFWLKMGMLPIEHSVSTETIHGLIIQITWEEFSETKKILEQPNGFSLIESTKLKYLKLLVSVAKNIKLDQVTNEMILASENDLRDFMEKSWSYTKEVFINRLLRILKKTPPDQKIPNTNSLESVCMTLSPEGVQRWKEAIENDQPFVPFRKLEHLQPFMSDTQKQELEEILEKRPNGVL